MHSKEKIVKFKKNNIELSVNFFDRLEIKHIEKIAGGNLYIIILLKLYCKSTKYNGEWPYNIHQTAAIIRENESDIQYALKLFLMLGIAEKNSLNHIVFKEDI